MLCKRQRQNAYAKWYILSGFGAQKGKHVEINQGYYQIIEKTKHFLWHKKSRKRYVYRIFYFPLFICGRHLRAYFTISIRCASPSHKTTAPKNSPINLNGTIVRSLTIMAGTSIPGAISPMAKASS